MQPLTRITWNEKAPVRYRHRFCLGGNPVHSATIKVSDSSVEFDFEKKSDAYGITCNLINARRHRVVSLVTHADISDVVWADDETGCYAMGARDAKGNRIVVERSGPIKIVRAKR